MGGDARFGGGGPPAGNDFFTSPPSSPFAPAAAPAAPQQGPVNQFGTPAGQVGGPAVPAQAPPPPAATDARTKVIVGGLVLVALVAVVFGGRFGWRHFAAEPVLPATLTGMPRVTGGPVTAALALAQQQAGDELAPGSEARVGLYTGGTGFGYVVVALRGSARPGTGDDGATGDWTTTRYGDVECLTQPAAQARAAQVGMTMCVRGFFRRAVMVMAIGPTTTDPASVARATDEVWAAQ